MLRGIRVLLGLFMTGLVASGITALPLEWEIDTLAGLIGIPPGATPPSLDGLHGWIAFVRQGLHETNARYPFIAYGTDWLAFAHFMIAAAFIGPLRDPVRNVWVITFGLIACAAVVPTAMIFGALRGIPFNWRLIDCSFGLVAAAPLGLARYYTARLAKMLREEGLEKKVGAHRSQTADSQ
jgi:hypothetical protein